MVLYDKYNNKLKTDFKIVTISLLSLSHRQRKKSNFWIGLIISSASNKERLHNKHRNQQFSTFISKSFQPNVNNLIF